MNFALIIMCIFPVLAGVTGFVLTTKNDKLRADYVDVVMFVQVVIVACVAVLYFREVDLRVTASNWFGIGLYLVMDKVRLLLCIVVTMVFVIISMFMKESLKEEKSANRLYLFFLLLMGFSMGAIMSSTIYNTLFFMMMAYVSVFFLMLHRQDEYIIRNTGIYSAFMMISFALVALSAFVFTTKLQSVGYLYLYIQTSATSIPTIVKVAGMLGIIGFGMWTGLFPTQFQVTRSGATSLLEISVIVTTVLSKLGVLGMFMIMRSIFSNEKTVGEILLVWSVVTMIWALSSTLIATDIRRILVGLNSVTNAIVICGGAMTLISGDAVAYPLRSVIYMLVFSTMSLVVLYMVALEMVRKVNTYEIKGLIASGKGHMLLMIATFIACASLAGIPGTAGYLAHSTIISSILNGVKWKWLLVVYVIQWAFLITASARVFMKFFVSKKEEPMHILSHDEKLAQTEESLADEQEEVVKNPYQSGEIALIILGVVQIIIGVLPRFTIGLLSVSIDNYFGNVKVIKDITYYTTKPLLAFLVAGILGIILYVNLVHGVTLRAARNKKNQKLKEDMKEE